MDFLNIGIEKIENSEEIDIQKQIEKEDDYELEP